MASNTVSSNVSPPLRHYKYVHEMDREERLASLKEWAQGKMYTRPGEDGTLQYNSVRGINSLAFGGQLRAVGSADDRYAGQYSAPVGPPQYSEEAPEEKKGRIKRWLEKRKQNKSGKRRESAPPYVP